KPKPVEKGVLYCEFCTVILFLLSSRLDLGSGYRPSDRDLTDELRGENGEDDFITEFVSGGPKCYAYHTQRGKREIKFTGGAC
uniref:Uncharacterized protein n=1 Tax=Mastacembelus armatus TaxID=205130 RepID=A0A7N8YN29_9TELE